MESHSGGGAGFFSFASTLSKPAAAAAAPKGELKDIAQTHHNFEAAKLVSCQASKGARV